MIYLVAKFGCFESGLKYIAKSGTVPESGILLKKWKYCFAYQNILWVELNLFLPLDHRHAGSGYIYGNLSKPQSRWSSAGFEPAYTFFALYCLFCLWAERESSGTNCGQDIIIIYRQHERVFFSSNKLMYSTQPVKMNEYAHVSFPCSNQYFNHQVS